MTLNELWIFTDSQKSIESIRQMNHFLSQKIQKSIEILQTCNVDVHIHWIPGHFDIPGNEKADKLAKSVISSNIITDDRFLSFDFLKRQIIESNLNRWKMLWAQNRQKGKHYEIFNTKPGDSKIKFLSNRFDKLTIATMMQLKLGHGYFKSYLNRLPASESKNCNDQCNDTQNPKHLIINCRHTRDERSQLIKKMKPQATTLHTLFGTNEGLKNLAEFLKITKIATRKWLLGQLDDENEGDEFGWGDLQR
ncbi:MAG: hypothetical protein ICV61_19870 [Microcoleus sp. Co-bin12]|nr:hypothetical protein [Microcoleus sp. Co-bin12]